jgi:hypothetical protein
MSIKSPIARIMLLLGTSIAVCAPIGLSQAADLSLGQRLRSVSTEHKKQARDAIGLAEITGTIDARGTDSEIIAPLSAVASHALAARGRFIAMRSAMEHAIMLSHAGSKTDIERLRTQMKELVSELSVIERSRQPESIDLVRRAVSLSSEWFEDGLKIISPPPEGVIELPLPMRLAQKANAAAGAIDQLVDKSVAERPAKRLAKVPRKQGAVAGQPEKSGKTLRSESALVR